MWLTATLSLIYAQSTATLIFTGVNQYDKNMKMSSVLVENITQRWQVVLDYPDTVLYIGTTGIEDRFDADGKVQLFQNVPNPFEGVTHFSLMVPEHSEVLLEIYSLEGKVMATYKGTLEPGFHQFRARLSVPQTYLLSALTEKDRMRIKMVNTGHADQNCIEYIGYDKSQGGQESQDGSKGGTLLPFKTGDMMQYVGYTRLADVDFQSQIVTQQQNGSGTIPLRFTIPLPFVTTGNALNITTNGATIQGNITNDSGYPALSAGFLFADNAQMNNADRFAVGNLSGPIEYDVTGLQPGHLYYFRAFASNVFDTVYGAKCNFNTSALPPTVTTNPISSITATTAVCGGEVTSDGGANVTLRGVCWSTSQNPTVSNSYTNNGSGTGSFTSSIAGLTAGTTYYVRAYATNSAGTSYGNQFTFTTAAPTVPTVATNNVSNITATSATCGGNVTSDGGASVTARGVCWSTLQNPTVSSSHTTDGSGTGSFTSSITGLTANTTYYVRAYATNSAGTAYGEQRNFTTTSVPSFTCGTSTVTDYDGNSYNTVQIGQQCWMKENLRTTHYSNGASIPAGGNSSSSTNPYYYNYSSSGIALAQRGYLYNWPAVMHGASSSNSNPSGVQGICPTGWHVPSDAEWTQLTNYVSSQSGYVCGTNNTNIAKALSSTTGWSASTITCVPGNNQSANNATGFSAVPAGYCNGSSFNDAGGRANFWSATQYASDPNYAYGRYLYYNYAGVDQYGYSKYYGFSVRCLRDASGGTGAPCNASDQCEYTFNLTDSYGDGWNNGSLAVVQNGVTVANITLTSGSSGTETVMLCNNQSTSLVWTPGSYVNEVGFTLEDQSGNIVCSYSAGSMSSYTTYTFTADCSETVVPASGSTSITTCDAWIYDNGGSTGNYQNSLDGYIVVNPATSGQGITLTGTYNTESCCDHIYVYSGTGTSGTVLGNYSGSGSISLTNSGVVTIRFYTDGSVVNSGFAIHATCSNSGSSFTCGTSTVSDYDGNTYNTVQIGSQCWTKENIRATHYADGTAIPLGGSATSNTDPYYYNYSSSGIALSERGYLYNWPAAMHGAASSSVIPSGVQGVCPMGWHLPSDAEWTQLTDYVSSQSQYVCGSNSTNIAKALSSTTGWNTTSSACAVGNNQSANNATGFSAVPAGYCHGSSFDSASYSAYFWSATQTASNPYYRSLGYFYAGVSRDSYGKYYGFSVRCLRD